MRLSFVCTKPSAPLIVCATGNRIVYGFIVDAFMDYLIYYFEGEYNIKVYAYILITWI